MSDAEELLEQRIRATAHRLWDDAGRPAGQEARFRQSAKVQIEREEAKLDREGLGSFPASDPPSSSVVTGATGEAQAMTEGDEPTIRINPASPASG
jgi:hypothetical protein